MLFEYMIDSTWTEYQIKYGWKGSMHLLRKEYYKEQFEGTWKEAHGEAN